MIEPKDLIECAVARGVPTRDGWRDATDVEISTRLDVPIKTVREVRAAMSAAVGHRDAENQATRTRRTIWGNGHQLTPTELHLGACLTCRRDRIDRNNAKRAARRAA